MAEKRDFSTPGKRTIPPIVKQYKAIRKAKNLTMQDVADLTGYSVSMLSKIETGARYPKITTMEILARAIGGKLQIGGCF